MADLYGGGAESFEEEARLLDRLAAKRAKLAEEEAAYQRLVGEGEAKDTRRSVRRRSRSQAAAAEIRAENTALRIQLEYLNLIANVEARLSRTPTRAALPPGRSAIAQLPPGRIGSQLAVATGAGGGGAITPPPIIPPGGGRGGGAAGGGDGGYGRGRRRVPNLAEDNDRASKSYERLADRERAARRAQGELFVTQEQYGQSIRRHGALTVEFFDALRRGEATLAELRAQVGATILKFGGWTAAAAAVYGALGAIRELGKGAIDSQSGVHQLQRVVNNVNTDKAKEDFRGLSREFNVPISVAADAAYRMGQVFHNQADATKAARAALYSYKTGEVDVASSTQNLIAIVNGFGLSAEDLTHVYDQINQAQNTFGIRIADTEAGLAKAAGTWRNAGGDLDYLLALFVAIQKQTGRSGQEIGTGLSRGIQQARVHAQELSKLGIHVDPNDIQKTYAEAFRVAAAHPEKIHDIARGLLGNQYSRLLESTLRNQSLFNAARQQTAPGPSRGSAQRELQKVLQQFDEQLRKIPNTLERLGSSLEQAGVVQILLHFVKLLNLGLDAASAIVDVFNGLPGPIRQALIYGLEFLAVIKLAQRFGAGSGPGLLSALTGNRGEAIRVRQLQTSQQRFLEDRGGSIANELQGRRYDVARDTEAVRHAEQQYGRGTQEATAAQERLTASHNRLTAAQDEAVFVQNQLNRSRATREELDRRVRRGEHPGTVARDLGIPYQPRPGESLPIDRRPGAVNLMPAVPPSRLQRAQRALEESGPITRRVTSLTASTFSAIGTGASRMGAAAKRIGPQLREVGSTLSSFFRDPLFGIMAGVAAGLALKSYFDRRGREADARGAGPGAIPPPPPKPPGPEEARRRLFGLRPPHPDVLSRLSFGALGEGGVQSQQAYDDALQQQKIEQDRLIAQNRARQLGRPVPERFLSEIDSSAKGTLEAFNQHRLVRREALKRLNQNLDEIGLSIDIDPAKREIEKAKVLALKAALAPDQRSLKEVLDQLPTKDFGERMQNDATAIGVFGVQNRRTRDVAAGYRSALERAKKDHFQGESVQRLQAAQQALQAAISKIQEDLQQALQGGGDPITAYTRAMAQLRHLPRSKQRAAAAKQFAQFASQQITQNLTDDLALAQTTTQSNAAFERALSQMRRLPAGRQRRLALHQIREQRLQFERDEIQSIGELAQARAGSNEVAKARAQLTTARREFAAIRRAGGHPNELRSAAAKVIEAEQAVTDAITQRARDTLEADKALALAGVRDPVRRAGIEARFAHRAINLAHTRNERVQAIAEARQADADLAEAIHQQAQELAQARQTFILAGIDDPLARARAELRFSRYNVRFARTAAERYQARADVREKTRSLRDQRVQTEIDNAEYEHDVGRMTDQALIRSYQNILKTMNMSKQTRRDLRRKIYQLRHDLEQESGFDLNVGNLKIPTAYEIRRAVQGGRGSQIVIQQSNRLQMNVTTEADVDAVFARVDSWTAGSLQANARSAGVG